jgi:hypothetical protein
MAKAHPDPDPDPFCLTEGDLKDIDDLKLLYDQEMQKRSDNGNAIDDPIDFNLLKTERACARRLAREEEVVSFLLSTSTSRSHCSF